MYFSCNKENKMLSWNDLGKLGFCIITWKSTCPTEEILMIRLENGFWKKNK